VQGWDAAAVVVALDVVVDVVDAAAVWEVVDEELAGAVTVRVSTRVDVPEPPQAARARGRAQAKAKYRRTVLDSLCAGQIL
jgi:hypothetical protein